MMDGPRGAHQLVPDNSPNCCTGSHNTAATCPPSGVQFYSYFSACTPARRLLLSGLADRAMGADREQLPEHLRLRLRREQRRRALHLPLDRPRELHRHVLPLKPRTHARNTNTHRIRTFVTLSTL
jgi:hypothetical protein